MTRPCDGLLISERTSAAGIVKDDESLLDWVLASAPEYGDGMHHVEETIARAQATGQDVSQALDAKFLEDVIADMQREA